jgi:hypothetical protein
MKWFEFAAAGETEIHGQTVAPGDSNLTLCGLLIPAGTIGTAEPEAPNLCAKCFQKFAESATPADLLKAAASDMLESDFSYAHLPPKMQEISMPFCILAGSVVNQLPRNPERTVALRKLLEAKDAAVRAAIFK